MPRAAFLSLSIASLAFAAQAATPEEEVRALLDKSDAAWNARDTKAQLALLDDGYNGRMEVRHVPRLAARGTWPSGSMARPVARLKRPAQSYLLTQTLWPSTKARPNSNGPV